MKFSVNAGALPGLADLMERRWQDLTNGHAYLADNTRIEAGQAGILNWLWGQHEKIVSAAGDFLSRAADGYAAPYARAIAASAAYYQHTDAKAAASLDATMPGVDDPGKHDAGTAQAITSLGPGFFADHMCPGDRYAPPIDHHAEARYNFTAFDLLSPTSQVREIIWKVSEVAVTLGLLDHPYDVIEEAVKPFSGDWAAFAGCADTFQHLADAVNDAGTCVMDGVSAIPQVWTGNAADQCAGGLARFSTDLTAAVGPLRATANAYASTAEQVRAHAEVLAALLTILIDEVAEAALAAVGGGLMEEFQIATTIEDSVQTILKMRKVVVTAWHVARAFAETGSVTTADLGILRNDHPMPNLIANVPSLPH